MSDETSVWARVSAKYPLEYDDSWKVLLTMVGGEPEYLLNSREVVRQRWPGLIGEVEPIMDARTAKLVRKRQRGTLWKRLTRAWHALRGDLL